jgi:hypothetical protein
MAIDTASPVSVEGDYPEELDRVSTFFRIILFIPVAFFLALLTGTSFPERGTWTGVGFAGAGGTALAIMAAVFVRQYVPHWLFDFQVWVMRFSARAYGYAALMTDRFPAFEGDYPIRIEVQYPDELNRWKVLVWKIISGIPHFIVLFFLYIAATIVVIIAWFAILFTKKYPRGLYTFVLGVMRWSFRVEAYVISLTDRYPPFSLE